MAKGRGIAIPAMVTTMAMLCLLLLQTERAYGATYTVGASGVWTFNVVRWPEGKRFWAGDVLVFNYDPTVHNVVVVNEAGYNSCRTPAGAKVYQTGSDKITLVKGQNYFICNFPEHCESDMKIAVNAM